MIQKTQTPNTNGRSIATVPPPAAPQLPAEIVENQQAMATVQNVIGLLAPTTLTPDNWAGVVAHSGCEMECHQIIRIINDFE